jgi:hypothetical protein
MDLTSLLWILENEQLHFSSPIDDFDDPYETTLPKAWYEFREEQWREIGGHWDHDPDEFWKERSQERKEMRNNIYANCWHANQTESAAMWELYGESKSTIAIRTTVEGLKKAFACQNEYAIAIGDVAYVDFDSGRDEIPDDDMEQIRRVHSGNADSIGLTLLKRNEFTHEKELRCVVLDGVIPDWLDDAPSYSANRDISKPVNVRVNLNHLIDEIRLPPGAKGWFVDTVIDAVENNRNTEFNRRHIRKSDLDSERHF